MPVSADVRRRPSYLTENHGIGGSIPPLGTIFRWLRICKPGLHQWSEACDGCRAEARKAYAVARGSTCRVLPPPERLLHRTVVLAAAPTPIAEKWFVATVAPEGVARKEDIVR